MKKFFALTVVGLGVAGALLLRQQHTQAPLFESPTIAGAKVVELGSSSCRSCKAMHEELAQLREECGTSIGVEEIDVWTDKEAARRYGVSVIPTQVFLDAAGHELDRHTGFLARADIRARFAEHGLECRR